MTRDTKWIFGGALCALILLAGVSFAAATEPPPAENEVYSLPEASSAGETEPVAARTTVFGGYVVRSGDGGVAVYDAADGERVAELDILPAKLREADAEELERGIPVADDEALARLIEDLSS